MPERERERERVSLTSQTDRDNETKLIQRETYKDGETESALLNRFKTQSLPTYLNNCVILCVCHTET